MILVQMHGDPGSGKSTLARGIGAALPAIVVDKDAISSALIRAGVDRTLAGPAAYEAMRALARDFLAAGHAVVLDSPCAWPSIEASGRALAEQHGVPWALIELECPVDMVDARLAARPESESQPRRREDWYSRPGTARPNCDRLVLDGTAALGELVAASINYLRNGLTDEPAGHSALSTPHSAPDAVLSPRTAVLP